MSSAHHVVIIGGGFGGLYAARRLGKLGKKVRITLIDRRNFHLFQPLLYQVATGGLSPSDIASPLRAVLNQYENISIIQTEVVNIRTSDRAVMLSDGDVTYDTLIVATGVTHHYFGQDAWRDRAPGLKTVEDALEIRRRIFDAFEKAEWTKDAAERNAWMTLWIRSFHFIIGRAHPSSPAPRSSAPGCAGANPSPPPPFPAALPDYAPLPPIASHRC